MRARPPIAVGVLTLLLAGCGAAEEEPVDANTPTPTETKTSAPALNYGNEVTDEAGDGEPVDLTNVSLSADGEELAATWTVEDIPAGESNYYLSVSGKDGEAAGQLGVKVIDGSVDNHFAFLDNTNTNLTTPASVNGNEVTATFPLDDIQAVLGDEFKWYASTTFDGMDVDTAPNYTDPINREYLVFQAS